jgi:hypothetical protein
MEYVSTADQPKITQRLKQTRVLLAFLALTPIVLMIVGKLVIRESFDGDLATLQKITKLLYSGTIGLGLAVVALRRIGLSLLTRRLSGATTDGVLKKLMALSLIGGALGEAVGILGFLAAFITHDYQFCWRMGVISLLIILYNFPRRWEWARAVTTATS